MVLISKWAGIFARTPLHPQWLLGRRQVPVGVVSAAGTILDIGAADRWIEPYLSAAAHYVALDFPSTGRDFYRAHPDIFADASYLPFSNGSFDGAVCLEVLEHVPAPDLVVSEIARVLKPGGRAWLSMPFLYPLHDAPFDFQRYTEYGLRRQVDRAGLELVSLQKSGHAIRTAGLLMCLAIAGGAYARRRFIWLLLLPLVLAAVLVVNVTTWLLSLIWPDWHHMAMLHVLEVRKP